jgi:hypothetical protein
LVLSWSNGAPISFVRQVGHRRLYSRSVAYILLWPCRFLNYGSNIESRCKRPVLNSSVGAMLPNGGRELLHQRLWRQLALATDVKGEKNRRHDEECFHSMFNAKASGPAALARESVSNVERYAGFAALHGWSFVSSHSS